MFKAFEGANGWYVAWEDSKGFHHQGSGNLSQAQAQKKAKEANDNR